MNKNVFSSVAELDNEPSLIETCLFLTFTRGIHCWGIHLASIYPETYYKYYDQLDTSTRRSVEGRPIRTIKKVNIRAAVSIEYEIN